MLPRNNFSYRFSKCETPFFQNKIIRIKADSNINNRSKIIYLFIISTTGTIIYYIKNRIFNESFDNGKQIVGHLRNSFINSDPNVIFNNLYQVSQLEKMKIMRSLINLFHGYLLPSPLLLLPNAPYKINSYEKLNGNNVMKINYFSEKQEDSNEAKLFEMQRQHSKEKEKLENEIKELRRQILLNRLREKSKDPKMKKSLIEMYSEVLDELGSHDLSHNAQDYLPRVVVVGEQSAGKTSVLEMVAQARLFPRGAGVMMTRAPVQVTLAEGPYPIARFDGENGPEFDLSTEQGQTALRAEIEARMNFLAAKTTISKQPISVSVQGPNIHRMVLVDLPGIINTVTTGMHADAKDAVFSLAKQYMGNPNAIILCIQDGSKDAESSSIVDLVSSMDPLGKRTIFVMTKVDLAESQMSNPSRIRDILSGKVFQMKALGYFAVIAGKGNKDESIKDIQKYEESFFEKSLVFREGAMQQHQLTTTNLSKAVSDKFWELVEEAVEQQCDSFKALRFNLETEWKHKFKGVRELDRVELFERAKGEILDNLQKFSLIDPHKWQDYLSDSLWDQIKDDVFENIFIPAHQLSSSTGSYYTTIDIKLKKWVETTLPIETIKIGENVFINQLKLVEQANENKSEDPTLFKPLKNEVYKESFEKYHWDPKAQSALKVIQSEALSDATIKSKPDWEAAVSFLVKSLEDQHKKTKKIKDSLKGPGFINSWLSWSSKSDIQNKRSLVMDELNHIFQNDPKHKMILAPDELTAIRRNLQLKKINVDTEFIKETWIIVYREHLYNQSLSSARDCIKGYFHYQNDVNNSGFDCRDVIMFWRLSKMLQASASALRMHIINNENRRLERVIKDELENVLIDDDKLNKLITGERAKLAEELKKIRAIQEKLELFIHSLKSKNV